MRLIAGQSYMTKQQWFLPLLLNLLMLRVVIPYLEWLFAGFALVSLVIIVSDRTAWNLHQFYNSNFLKISFPYLLTTLILFFSFLVTREKTFLLYRELLVALFLVYYLILAFAVIDSPSALKSFVDHFKEQFIVITALAALFGLIKFILNVSGVHLGFLSESGFAPVGTSLKVDHNFYSLGMAIGFILVLDGMVRRGTGKFLVTLLLLLYSFNIVFSSSRRGIVLLVIIIIGTVLLVIVRKRESHNILKVVLSFLSILFITLFFSVFGLYQYGKQADHFMLKQEIASILTDYKSVIQPNANLADTYKSLWKSDYIEDWRANKYASDSDLQFESGGKNAGLSRSSPLDMLRNLETTPGWHRWMAMRTEKISEDTFKVLRVQGFHPEACLHRFIDLETGIVDIYLTMNIRIIRWNKVQRIELRWGKNKKVKYLPEWMNDGKWHHIEVHAEVDTFKKVQLVLYFTGLTPQAYGEVLVQGMNLSSHPTPNIDYGSTLGRLNTIKTVEASFPKEIYRLVNIDTVPWNVGPNLFMDTIANQEDEIIYTYSDSLGGVMYKTIVIPFTHFWRYSAFLFPFQAGKNLRIETRNMTADNYTKAVFAPDIKWSENDTLGWFRLESVFYAEKGDTVRLGVHLFPDTIPQLAYWNHFRLTTHPYQEAVCPPKYIPDKLDMKYIKQQAENKRYSDSISRNEESDFFFVPRKLRWAYALELYTNYPLWKKIVGGGFGYLRKFKDNFPSVPGYYKVEYPHNIFLSVLLYSGIIGFVVFIWLMYATIKLYVHNRLYILLLSWLMIFSFVIFSSDTMFELPLFGGFTILPFLYQVCMEKAFSKTI